MKRVKLIYIVDLALFVQFLLVGGSGLIMYFYHHAGSPLLRLIHDKIGILMLVFFVVHIVLNWKWIVSATKNFSKKGKKIKENYVMDLALFVQFLLVGVSGLIMYFYRHAGGSLLRLIHDKIGILMLVFFVVHIILNWEWIVGTTKKLCKKGKEIKEIEIIDKDYVPTN
jgi:succinate dehydrogenase/fumarate reductase cytochrome b subunit